jgi:hypothetical protein
MKKMLHRLNNLQILPLPFYTNTPKKKFDKKNLGAKKNLGEKKIEDLGKIPGHVQHAAKARYIRLSFGVAIDQRLTDMRRTTGVP